MPSQTTSDMYSVDEFFRCNCPDSQKRNVQCKHSFAVRFFLQAEKTNGQKIEKVRLTYPQAWKMYDLAQTNEIKLFAELLKDLVEAIEEPQYAFGRPRLSKKEVVFCCNQKAYSQLSARRASSLFGSAVERKQLGHPPHFTSVNGYLRDESLTPILHGLLLLSSLPLKAVETKFGIDSTGFRPSCFGQYCEEKYDLNRESGWIKTHLCTGIQTNVVTSCRITPNSGKGSGDSPKLPFVIQETAQGGFVVKEVLADKAYGGRDNHDVVNGLGGTLYSPFRENATGNAKGSQTWKKAFYFFKTNQNEFYQHYSLRANEESTISAIKRKLGDSLNAKSDAGQNNELLCKLISYNITVLIAQMYELGITPDFKLEENMVDLNKKSALRGEEKN